MKTFMSNPSGQAPGWLKRGFTVLQKSNGLRSAVLLLVSCFLLSAISFGQSDELKKGYSKADYLAAFETQQNNKVLLQKKGDEQFFLQPQQQKVVFPEPVEEKCGFNYVEKVLQKMYPNRKTTVEFEQWMQQKIALGEYNASRAVKVIPVVVHVIHNGEDVGVGPNITEEQVLSQIDVMNEDFRRLNTDATNTPDDFIGVAADAELEFCLATVTPDGDPTNGIHRYDGGQNSYSVANMETTIKPTTIWNPDYYFNIWVCNLSPYLGYAQFPDDSGLPGLPPDIDQDGTENTDGIVILQTSFGTTGTATPPFHLGRTATHEAGHFFGLRHIWGDRDDDGFYSCDVDDFVDDTPSQLTENYTGSPCLYPGPNSCTDEGTDYPDQFMNFLDYSDDVCMNMFTEGQISRFEVVIANSPRRNFELSQVCDGIPPPSDEAPVNDLCENALPISCDGSVEASTVDATFDDVGFCGTTNTAPGVWYTFVADGYGVNLSTCNNANYDTKISVFTGSCELLECVGGQDDGAGCPGFTTDLTVNTIPGESYYVLVHGFGSATGTFTLTLTCLDTPENDLCENAFPIACDESVDGSTVDAIFDDVGFCGISNTAPGVWYTFVATEYKSNLSTCDDADYDTKISVFTGSCEILECVGGQDDGADCPGFTTDLTVNTIPGESYYVMVHGYGGATGDFTLTLTCPEPPDNDLCENAEPVECGDIITGNTEWATDLDAQDDCIDDGFDLPPGYGVWYTMEGTGGDIILSTCNDANFDTRIDVYTGSCGDLTCYAGNDDNFPDCADFTSELTFASNAGETYYIYVSGFASAVGDFTLTVTCCVVAEAGECATVYWGYEPAECTDLTASGTYGTPPYSYQWSTGETTGTITVCPTETTTYTVTVTDGYGCVSTDDVTVEVVDVRCGKKLDKVEICHIPPDNPENPHVICISPNAVPDHLSHGDHLGACGIEPCNGLYYGDGGAKSSKTGGIPVVDEDDWNIYPNPAYDRVTIDLTILHGHKAMITIFDASGKAFWNHPLQILKSPVIEIDMNTIPSGIYHVVLRTESQSMVKKLVVTK